MIPENHLESTLPPDMDTTWPTAPPELADPDHPTSEHTPPTATTPTPPTTTSGPPRLHGPVPVIPGFTFVRPLGRGGFSDVHLYREHRPDRDVAVKVISDATPVSAHRAAIREGDLMAAVSVHPSIVDVYGMGETDDGRPFLVMEYCPGPSLVDRLRDGPLPLAEALSIGVRLAGALETAHHWGVVHRDVKPSNVLTNQFGAPTLTDFGIAGYAGGDEEPLTAVSVPWSPPELLDAVRLGDRAPGTAPALAADVYALAATVWTMLTARAPFVAEAVALASGHDAHDAHDDPDITDGDDDTPNRVDDTPDTPDLPPDTPRAAVARAVRSMPVPPTNRGDVPEALELALRKGMAKRPQDRFATVAEFGRELQRIEHHLRLPSTTMDIPRVLPPHVPHQAASAPVDPDAVPVPDRGGDAWEPQTWRESTAPTPHPKERSRAALETENAMLRALVVILSVLLAVAAATGVVLLMRTPGAVDELRQFLGGGTRITLNLLSLGDPLPATWQPADGPEPPGTVVPAPIRGEHR